MKIWLPINERFTGGSSIFAHKFKQGMEQRQYSVEFSYIPPADYDVLLVSPRAPVSMVYNARRQGKQIIHRLDGAYYPASPAGWLFPAYNAELTAIQLISSFTIYQSRYAQFICQRFVGARTAKKSTIIYNGVDADEFTPIGPQHALRTSPDQHIFFTAQEFRRRDQIEPLIQAFEYYQQNFYQNARLVIAGNLVGQAAKFRLNIRRNPQLMLLGPVKNADLPWYLRVADVFVFCHPNPACPNNVLEAMACGVPIVGINDGAMPELVRHEQDGYLLPLPGHGLVAPRLFNPAAFAQAMHNVFGHKAQYGRAARARVLENFTLVRMIDQYIDILLA